MSLAWSSGKEWVWPAPCIAKYISIPTTTNTATNAIAPGIWGKVRVQKGGRHGSVKEPKAVGSRWTNAVAIRTPVPKCREKKRKRWGVDRDGMCRTINGIAHAIRQRLDRSMIELDLAGHITVISQ